MQERQPVPTYFGRYQVLEELGSGAMGVVYLCVDPRLARPVAVKVIRESEHMTPAEKEQFLARFRHEAEAAGRLNHPGIVQIYDIGPSYLVMEYLDGKALSTVMKAGGHVYTVQEVCSIVLQVSDAIDYAHKHGIVHRDIKPANIMMMDDGGVKVMDFGVARLESSTLTVAGTVVGSVRYMAPEQMMGERVDARADVFSLGAVAYEMLTARAPFPGKTITEVVGQVVHGAYVPPRQVDDRLPEELNDVFGGAFAVNPDDRYPSAMDFARDLYAAAEAVLDLRIGADADHPPPSEVGTTLMAPTATSQPVSATARTVRMPADAVATREGFLLVDSEPSGAEVYLDGKPLGATPVAGVEVGFGRHVLRIEKEGRDPVSAEVEVKREQPLKVLSFTLPVARAGGEPLRSGQFVPFGPHVVAPVRLSGAIPEYPPAARERGMEGSPVVDIWIDEKGNVMDVAIIESAGAMLDGAVLEAVAAWKFRPATIGGTTVSVRMTLQHLFRR